MKVHFLGVGEAFDENYPNNSHIVSTDKTNLLLDCGYGVPYELWKYNSDPNFLDVIFISHRHADHCFGLPPIVVRMWEGKRTKPLTINTHKGVEDSLVEVGYKNFSKNLNFEVKFEYVDGGQEYDFQDLKLSFAETEHSAKNLGVKVEAEGKSVCYSGDGMFTPELEELYKGSDLVIQETYLYDEEIIGHASVVQAIEMAKRSEVKCLALTHLNREFRIKAKEIINLTDQVILPEPGEEYIC